MISQIFYLVSQNKLPFRLQHYNPKVFYWNEIWLLCRPFENDELRAGHGQQQHLGRLRHSYDAQLVLRSANIKEKTSLTSLYQQQLPELLMQGRMDKCFHVVYTKSWPSHLNIAAEIKTHQMRVHFSNFLLSSFAKLQLQFFVFSWQEWYSVWSCGAAVRLLRHLCSEMLFMVVICDYLIYCRFSVTMSTMSSPFPLTSDMKRAFFL